MNETLYSRRPNLVIAFHGCDKSVADKVISGKEDLIASTNEYDCNPNCVKGFFMPRCIDKAFPNP